MKALVTGCAGFVGSHVTESLLRDGIDVIGVDCFNDNYGRSQKRRNLEQAHEWNGFDFVPIDLARGHLAHEVADCDVVFHLAAEPGVRSSWGGRFELYLRNNVLATQQLLEALRDCPETRLVFASSSSVYGQAESFPTPEDALPAPFSPYGVTKLAAEQLCRLYHGNHGLDVVVLRYFSVYGPRQRPDMAFHIFCRSALEGAEITVFGDGGQTRDFTHVADVVAATRACADRRVPPGTLLNIGGGTRTSLADALACLEALAGAPLRVRHLDVQRGDVRDTAADTTRARRVLGFQPAMSLARGLADQLAWTEETLRVRPGRR